MNKCMLCDDTHANIQLRTIPCIITPRRKCNVPAHPTNIDINCCGKCENTFKNLIPLIKGRDWWDVVDEMYQHNIQNKYEQI